MVNVEGMLGAYVHRGGSDRGAMDRSEATSYEVCNCSDADLARGYSADCLDRVGKGDLTVGLTKSQSHPALSWKRAGLDHVTGMVGGASLMAPLPLTACADGALAALQRLAPSAMLAGASGAAMLGERIRRRGLSRQGATAAGGNCKILQTIDGRIAVSLVRASDWDVIPAWLGGSASASWSEVARLLSRMRTEEALQGGRLLGLALADAMAEPRAAAWCETITNGPRRTVTAVDRPVVVDLSSLWAGPLCADLLGRLGATVIKVESTERPDGARQGNADFYARLNGGKHSVAVDFTSHEGRSRLLGLIKRADIVIESARPRALRQLGIDAEAIVAQTPGLSWIAISGYGRGESEAGWAAFGDDAGVGAGLSRLMHEVYGQWLFCGDAIADPLSGLHAALVAWSSWLDGGGVLQAVSLHGVVANAVAFDASIGIAERRLRTARWAEMAAADDRLAYPLPQPRGVAEPIGASNARFLGEGQPC